MISICMATYNGEKFVREQLESILSQLPTDAEIIIADDGSTDNTLSIINSFSDKRIRILPFEKHQGIISNYERALKAASGETIFLADQDDVWLPGKVAKVIHELECCDLVLHDAFMYHKNEVDNSWQRKNTLSSIRPYKTGVLRNWFKNSYTGCCMAFRRNVLEKALPFPRNLPMHDQWIGFIAEKFFKVKYLAEPLIEYRQHSKNATHIENSPASILHKIRWRLNLAISLLKRDFFSTKERILFG